MAIDESLLTYLDDYQERAGAFGTVHKAMFNGEPVAVKIPNGWSEKVEHEKLHALDCMLHESWIWRCISIINQSNH